MKPKPRLRSRKCLAAPEQDEQQEHLIHLICIALTFPLSGMVTQHKAVLPVLT